jgi:hypothetical protein
MFFTTKFVVSSLNPKFKGRRALVQEWCQSASVHDTLADIPSKPDA